MKSLKFLALSLCLFSLSACETMENLASRIGDINTPLNLSGDSSPEMILDNKCPRVEVVGELASFSEFTDSYNKSPDDLVSRVDLAPPESSCVYAPKSVTVDLKLAFDGVLGPRARLRNNDKPFFAYPFFVAIVSPSGEILAKEIFSATMTFPRNQNRQTYFENLRQIIPVSSPENGARHKVLVGFQLTPDQLAYNRANLRPMMIRTTPDMEPDGISGAPIPPNNRPVTLVPGG